MLQMFDCEHGVVLLKVERLRTLIVEIALVISGLLDFLIQNYFALSILKVSNNRAGFEGRQWFDFV